MRVAITGASGFIGNRVVEMLHLGNIHELVPVVYSNSSLALPARFNLPWRVCNHFSADELSGAFLGCDAVVHAAYGSPAKKMAKAVYRAADKAGVRRVVVLSTASVYNQNPAPGITEDSPLPKDSATSYNSAKISADRAIRRLRTTGKTEVVFLMPGVVYGPRSQWTAKVVRETAEGTAYLIGDGQGICNGIYIDNLVDAVRLAIDTPGIDNESFFVSDAETIRWIDFYRPLCLAIGSNVEKIHRINAPKATREPVNERIQVALHMVAASAPIQTMKPYVPRLLIQLYKAVMTSFLSKTDGPPSSFTPHGARQPQVTLDMSLLQQCSYKLPNTKAERLLNYRPSVTFEEGMKRTIGWMKFAGYHVRHEPDE